jgi:hypothetical protein
MNVRIGQTTCIGGEMIINGKRVVNHGGGPMTVVTNGEGCARTHCHALAQAHLSMAKRLWARRRA